MNPTIKISTTGDLQLNVQKVETRIRNAEGIHPTEAEICLLVSGLNSISEETIEEFITISKDEARNFAMTLWNMANK